MALGLVYNTLTIALTLTYVCIVQLFGVAPVLKDGDFEVGQSSAILRYIASKCGEYNNTMHDMVAKDISNSSTPSA